MNTNERRKGRFAMKKKILVTVLTLFGVMAGFTQEKIAVFPFEDMDNVLTKTEAFFFYDDFSNEFKNKSAGKFTVIERQEVEKLIGKEADFQLSVFSAKEKTAEMNRVLNGTQILTGRLGKIGNGIRITVSLYKYPDLERLTGGTTLTVANTTELFNKIPELVQKMLNTINPPKPPPSPLPPLIPDWTFYNGLTILGYTYSFDTPLGFTLGTYGVYTSFGFSAPKWNGYKKVSSVSSGTSSSYVYPPDYNTSPILDQRYSFFDWVIGYNVTIIPNILYLPLGVGMETVKEWRLQNLLDYAKRINTSDDPEWNPAPQGENSFLFEAGLLLRIRTPINLGPYIFGAYRNIGFNKKHSFAIGIGASLEFIHDDWLW